MNIEAVKDEILSRMNMSELSLTSMDMIDIMNMFDINEEQLGLAYNSVVNDQMQEMSDTSDYVMDYFRDEGNHYPSFESFKDEFEKDHQVSDSIIRQLYKKQIEDENQLSLFEIIKQEVSKFMKEEKDFERAAAKIKKNWGGEGAPEEELNPEDLFGPESIAALGDIEAEYGEDETAPFGTMENPKQFVDDLTNESEGENPCWDGYEMVGTKKKDGEEVPNCVPKNESIKGDSRFNNPEYEDDYKKAQEKSAEMDLDGIYYDLQKYDNIDDQQSMLDDMDIDWELSDEYKKDYEKAVYSEEEGVQGGGNLFNLEDAQGNQIKRHLIVKPVSGVEKFGRVTGFGDDGKGNMIVLVDWQWPIDMKHTNPEEMGKDKVYPKDIVVRSPKIQESNINSKTNEKMEINEQEFSEELKNISESAELEEALKMLSESMQDESTMDENLEEGEEIVLAKPNVYNAIMNYHNIGGTKYEVLAIVDDVFGKDKIENINETKVPETIERIERLKSVVGAEELADLIVFKMEDSLLNSVIDAIEQDYGITSYEDDENLDESGRGLGKGVKRSGDRNVKMRDDHHSAPLTNLNESIDHKINKLFEGSVKKKDLMNFVKNEAKVFAENIKNENK